MKAPDIFEVQARRDRDAGRCARRLERFDSAPPGGDVELVAGQELAELVVARRETLRLCQKAPRRFASEHALERAPSNELDRFVERRSNAVYAIGRFRAEVDGLGAQSADRV